MALVPGLFLIMLSSYSLEMICNLLGKHSHKTRIFLILMLLIFGFNLISIYAKLHLEESNKILETEIVMQIVEEIPNDCSFVSEFPIVLNSVSDLKGMNTDEGKLRATAVRFGIAMVTTTTGAAAAARAIAALRMGQWSVRCLQEYYPHYELGSVQD